MKIKDISKKNKLGKELEITSDNISLNRYTIGKDNKYYEVTDNVERENNKQTTGTIFQNEGILETKDIKENTYSDFIPVSQSEEGKNYYIIDHPDKVKAEARFSEMKRLDVYAEKGTINIENPDEETNHPGMIKSGFNSYAANQDENNDNLSTENVNGALKYAALSSTNIGGVGTTIKGIVDSANSDVSNFDLANQKVLSWKKDNYKQIHMNDYKDSQYYNDITNLANTKNKLNRGELGYGTNITDIGKNILAKFGDNDYPEDFEEIAELNLANQYTMYTSKPGTKIKSKDIDSDTPYVETIYNNNLKDYNPRENAKELQALSNNHRLEDEENPYNPRKLSDAQARMISMLKYKNSYLETLGCIYVKPFYNSNNEFQNFIIPFEFKPSVSEGSLTAKYQAESLLNRLGSLQVYTGTELSTLTVSTTYMALAPDDPTLEDMGKQFNTNAWEFNWTPNRIDSIEYQLRSLVFPALKNNDGYMNKPPIVQIMIGGTKELPTVGTLFKYPMDTEGYKLSDYLKISGVSSGANASGSYYTTGSTYAQWKKYVVTSVQIDNLDSDIMSYPSLYTYYAAKRNGQEEDGIGANVYAADSVGNPTEDSSSEIGNHVARRRGFKVTLQLTEVSENFLDIVPDFRAYYNSAKKLSGEADKVATATKSIMGVSGEAKDIINALTADANSLIAETGGLEESIKDLLSKAYLIAKNYYVPSNTIFSYGKSLFMLYNEDYKEVSALNDKLIEFETDFSKFKPSLNFVEDSSKVSFDDKEYYKNGKELYSKENEYKLKIVKTSTAISITTNKNRTETIYNFKDKTSVNGYNNRAIEISISDCPFVADKGASIPFIKNQNICDYFNNYFKTYFKLLSASEGKTKVHQYIKDLVSCFEKGGELYGFTEKGSKVKLCKVPAVDDVLAMFSNTFGNLFKEHISLSNSVSIVMGNKFVTNPMTIDFISKKVEDSYIISAKFSDASISNQVFPKDYDINGNDTFKDFIDRVFEVIEELKISFMEPLYNYYTKEGLKNKYETIMKDYKGIPATYDLTKFKNTYGSSPEDLENNERKFIEQEYNGLENIPGVVNVSETDDSKLSDYDANISVARQAVKLISAKRNLNVVEIARKEGEENIDE